MGPKVLFTLGLAVSIRATRQESPQHVPLSDVHHTRSPLLKKKKKTYTAPPGAAYNTEDEWQPKPAIFRFTDKNSSYLCSAGKFISCHPVTLKSGNGIRRDHLIHCRVKYHALTLLGHFMFLPRLQYGVTTASYYRYFSNSDLPLCVETTFISKKYLRTSLRPVSSEATTRGYVSVLQQVCHYVIILAELWLYTVNDSGWPDKYGSWHVSTVNCIVGFVL